MVDADDFDVESLRALLRGEAPQPAKRQETAPDTATARKGAKRKSGKAKPATRAKKGAKR